MGQTGVRSGILLLVVGLWVLMRTVTRDQSGRTLIDHLLSKQPNWGKSPSLPQYGLASTPQAAAASTAAIHAAQNPAGIPYGITHPFSMLTPPGSKIRITGSGVSVR